jgi:hypothetical protein
MDEVGRGWTPCYDWLLPLPSNLPTYMDKRGKREKETGAEGVQETLEPLDGRSDVGRTRNPVVAKGLVRPTRPMAWRSSADDGLMPLAVRRNRDP